MHEESVLRIEREGRFRGRPRARQDDPATYLRIVAGLLPREVKLDASPVDMLTDEELTRMIDEVRSAIERDGEALLPFMGKRDRRFA